MNGNIDRRLARLEVLRRPGLSPSLRAWLGHTLTADEQVDLAAMPEEGQELSTEVEMADWSPELREWLSPIYRVNGRQTNEL